MIALITGITGQDGSYLAELLLSKGYTVVGIVRRTSTPSTSRISHLLDNSNLILVEGEICDSGSVYSIIEKYKPNEVYNLAAQSHVGTSFQQPLYTFDVNAKGPLNLLEAIKRYSPETRFYQASTSELFGSNYTEIVDDFDGRTSYRFQDEKTAFSPRSPYAIAKLAAHNLVGVYRDAYDIHANAGILFNHESERRGELFVTRKITKWIGEFYHWREEVTNIALKFDGDYIIHPWKDPFPKLRLGNIDAYRDWGHAEDYVKAMWLMLQQQKPDDYVISTGRTYSVRNFLEKAFQYVNITNFEPYIVIDPKFYRPAEVDFLRGDSTKAKEKLGWVPKISFQELVERMVRRDIDGKEKAP